MILPSCGTNLIQKQVRIIIRICKPAAGRDTGFYVSIRHQYYDEFSPVRGLDRLRRKPFVRPQSPCLSHASLRKPIPSTCAETRETLYLHCNRILPERGWQRVHMETNKAVVTGAQRTTSRRVAIEHVVPGTCTGCVIRGQDLRSEYLIIEVMIEC